MFLDNDTNPASDVYCLGAKTIEILASEKDVMVDFFNVYQRLNISQKVSLNLFVFTVDWLFLLGLIKKGNKGYIEKCF